MPPRIKVVPGQRYGRLVIAKEVEQIKRRRRFLCRCDCGNMATVDLAKLRSAHTRSCGCLQAESRKNNTRTHGLSKTRLYSIWAGIKDRCLNPSVTSYPYYGGRGISFCPEWDSFESFAEWALANGYCDSLSLERINNDGDYCPDNCTWIPFSEQVNNTRKSILITYQGKTQNLKQWAAELNMKYLILYKRIVVRGWVPERAFTTPSIDQRRYITYKGETLQLCEWSEKLGLSDKTLRSRLRRGWSAERAFETPVKGSGK